MQRALQRVDQEADSFGSWEQQITADPWECSKPRQQKDDNVAEKDKAECELPKFWEGNSLNKD